MEEQNNTNEKLLELIEKLKLNEQDPDKKKKLIELEEILKNEGEDYSQELKK